MSVLQTPPGVSSFVLYVEGARDRDILHAWAQRVSPPLADVVTRNAVILGGRQPRRAVEHFRGSLSREGAGEVRGLCVLDGDGGEPVDSYAHEDEPGLQFFTWSRRHIESYLLVPSAIRRSVRQPADASRVERILRRHLPSQGDEAAYRRIDAKRLLGPEGVINRAIRRPLAPGRIARAMHQREFHPDIHDLLGMLRVAL